MINLAAPEKGVSPPCLPSPPLLHLSAPTAHECVLPELVSPAAPVSMIEDYLHDDIVGNDGLPKVTSVPILCSFSLSDFTSSLVIMCIQYYCCLGLHLGLTNSRGQTLWQLAQLSLSDSDESLQSLSV